MSKPVLLIEDFSALGQISMIGALSVLQAMGITTAALPATVLSSQTEGFGQPAVLDTEQWIDNALRHWQDQAIKPAGILIGYLGQRTLADRLGKWIHQNDQDSFFKMIDPVMGDQGKLYPGFDQDYVQSIRKLCHHADLITPNWTELCLLTNQPICMPTAEAIKQGIACLRSQQITADVIVTGVRVNNQVGCCFLQDHELRFYGNSIQPGHFYGTGDVFAALLYGRLLQHWPLDAAISNSIKAMEQAIQQTAPLADSERRFGLRLDHLMQFVIRHNRE